MPTAVDVLVVGAGPAGAAAGLAARRRGLDVLVVDKASFPRDKTCGDGLTTAALRLIEQLGVDLRTLPGYMAVRETVLVGPDGRRVSLPLATDGDHAAVVPRVELDAAIVDTARRSGVEVRDGVAVSGIDMSGDGEAVTATTAEGDSVRARFLIAADGHYSFVRRCLRPPAPPELGTWHAFRQYFRGVDDPRLYVLFEADLLPGYAWVFPLPEGRANVGFGVLRRPGMSGKELNARWRELLEDHHATVRRLLLRYRGTELDTAGDGFFAAFDGPARGIRCARAITESVRDLGIEVRAGLHTGECERMNAKVGGIAVHIGARVAAEAGPGEVVVSSTVKDLVAGSGIAFRDRGAAELKGVPGEWRLFAVESG